MDYKRIEKLSAPSGGFSPGKLRAMLLGVEKTQKRRQDEELETTFPSKSDLGEEEDRCTSTPENCKDVEIVSLSSRFPAQEADSLDTESVLMGFEFQRAERAQHHRSALMPPFSKPAPSKWDDAQKWIASPMSRSQGKGGIAQLKRTDIMGYGCRQPAAASKIILEVPEDAATKKMDLNQGRNDMIRKKGLNGLPEPYPLVDWGIMVSPTFEDSIPDRAISLSQHDSSASAICETTCIMPPTTVKSVSMRDMGTEMTPISSQEPSRTGTPARATTPTRSPTSSPPDAPPKTATSTVIESADKELSEKELRIRTRREIMVLGTQLGKMNITAWASKEEEENHASASLKTDMVGQPPKSVTEARASAWEEAEKAKYLARFKREEIKIQAWENHQKAKTEAEMRKVEVEVERMRSRTHNKVMSKQAAAKHKAEGKRAAAEARRNQQAAITVHQAEEIRRTGRSPSSFSCWGCCS